MEAAGRQLQGVADTPARSVTHPVRGPIDTATSGGAFDISHCPLFRAHTGSPDPPGEPSGGRDMHLPGQAFGQFDFGQPLTFANLTMIRLLHRDQCEAASLTLEEAIATGRFRVTEVSDFGHVPELRVRNDLDVAVLPLDGEELVGAKQNRIVNLTILVPAHADLTIPVSCVEAGRWDRVSEAFAGSSRAHFAEGRARKTRQVSHSLAMDQGAHADQGDVWDRISHRVALSGAHAPTAAMADGFEARHQDVEDYVRALAAVGGQAGAAFAIGGRLAGLEWFDAPAALHKLLPKIVSSYALDAAFLPPRRAAAPVSPVGPDAVRDWVDRLNVHSPREHDTVGLGVALRWDAPGMTAAGLRLDARLIHFVGFPVEDQVRPRGRMQSASERRRRRWTE